MKACAHKGTFPEDRAQDAGPGCSMSDEKAADNSNQNPAGKEECEDKPRGGEDGCCAEEGDGREGDRGEGGEGTAEGCQIRYCALEDGLCDQRSRLATS